MEWNFVAIRSLESSNRRSRKALAKIVWVMKTQTSFEMRAYIKGRVNLNDI